MIPQKEFPMMGKYPGVKRDLQNNFYGIRKKNNLGKNAKLAKDVILQQISNRNLDI